MNPDDVTARQDPLEALDSARADLEGLGGLLQGAGRGEVKPADIKKWLEDYWQDHEPALRLGASGLSEEVRLQTIAELNKWREQRAARDVLKGTSEPDSRSEWVRPPAPSGEADGSCVPEPNEQQTAASRVFDDCGPPEDALPAAVCKEPDKVLDVPVLKVTEIDLEPEEYRAHVLLMAELADLVRQSVAADVNLARAKLKIKRVETQALVKARLEEVRLILDKALITISDNPEILDTEVLAVDRTLKEVAGAAREPVSEGGAAN